MVFRIFLIGVAVFTALALPQRWISAECAWSIIVAAFLALAVAQAWKIRAENTASDPRDAASVDHAFLSELDAWPRLQRLLVREGGLLPALAFSLAGALTLILGHFANVNALRIDFISKIKLSDAHPEIIAVPTVSHVFGYLGEPNHGLHVLLIGPIFIWLAFAFFRCVSVGFRQLEEAGSFEDRLGQSPTAVFARWNRHLAILGVFLAAVLLAKNFALEVPSAWRAAHGQGGAWEIGYVQALGLAAWAERFNQLPPKDKRQLIDDKSAANAQRIRDAIHGTLAAHMAFDTEAPSRWKEVAPTTYGPLSPAHHQDLFARGAFTIDVTKAAETGLLTPTVEAFGGPATPTQRNVFWAFLVISLLVEATFHAFAAYVGLKALFWLAIIYFCLPGGWSCRLFLVPQYTDRSKRYGFHALHAAYNLLVFLVAITGYLFALACLNSIGPILDAAGAPSNANAGRVLMFIGVFLLALVIIVGPLFLFHRKLTPGRLRYMAERNRQADGASPADIDKIGDELETVRNQKTWPHHDGNFWFAALAVVAFLAMPWAALLSRAPFDADRYVNFAHETKALAITLCAWRYPDLPRANSTPTPTPTPTPEPTPQP